jgi:hypothetical protein
MLVMGLDSVIMYKNSETEEYTANIPQNIVETIIAKCPNIIGITSTNPNYISFTGKAYANTVSRISKYSLYQDIDHIKIHIIHQKFKKFNDEYQEKFSELNEIYNSVEIDEWIDMFTEQYVPSPREIVQLEKLFAICIEYELMIYASY